MRRGELYLVQHPSSRDPRRQRKAAAQRLIEFGKRLREPGTPEIAEAELEAELKAVRAEFREARA